MIRMASGRRVENRARIIASCLSEELPHADDTVGRSDQLRPRLEILERRVSRPNMEIARGFHCTDAWIMKGVDDRLNGPREHKATEQPVVFVFIDAPEPVELGSVGGIHATAPLKLNDERFARRGGMKDQAG